jgi:hypothetical protein
MFTWSFFFIHLVFILFPKSSFVVELEFLHGRSLFRFLEKKLKKTFKAAVGKKH